MDKILRHTTKALQRRKTQILSRLVVPPDVVRASYVEQYLTCGKPNCRCQKGAKHGPFSYLVQSLGTDRTRKFLLKSAEQKERARAAIAAYSKFQGMLEELSQINTELLRRGENVND